MTIDQSFPLSGLLRPHLRLRGGRVWARMVSKAQVKGHHLPGLSVPWSPHCKSFVVFVLACGIEPWLSSRKAQGPNHWTAKEFPKQGAWTQSEEGKSGSSIIFLILALHTYKQPCQRCFLALFLCRL